MAKTKITTRSVPDKLPGDRIEGPHIGSKTQVKGAQTAPEAHALAGPSKATKGSVKQVGPSEIRLSGSRGQVVRVGSDANWEDLVAVGVGAAPNSRQEGSVKQVGPADIEFVRLTERRSSPQLQTVAALNAPKTSDKKTVRVPLLKSGVGRVIPWVVKAEQPGTMRGSLLDRSQTDILVNGRKRAFGPLIEEREEVTPDESIVLGDKPAASFGPGTV